jgi:DNA-binding MarR family transcriptional regulator
MAALPITRGIAILRDHIKVVREFSDDQMTPQALHILLEVAQKPGLTMQELADRTGLALSSVSRNLMALGEWHRLRKPGLGLVDTIEDPKERRRKIAFLSIRGRQFVERCLKSIMPEEAEIRLDSSTAREFQSSSYRAGRR